MIFLEVSASDDDREETPGFNCGPSDADIAVMLAKELKRTLRGTMTVHEWPEMVNINGEHSDYRILVTCPKANLDKVLALVGLTVATWRQRRLIPPR